jgi:hypothetical protein
MKKLNYITFLFLLLIVSNAKAQDVKQQSKIQESAIEGLSLYPNPVTNGRVYMLLKMMQKKKYKFLMF